MPTTTSPTINADNHDEGGKVDAGERRKWHALGWILTAIGIFVATGPALSGAADLNDGGEYQGSNAEVGPGTVIDNTSAQFDMKEIERAIGKTYANDSKIREYTGWQNYTWENPAIWYNADTGVRLGAVFRVSWPTPSTFPVGFPIVADSTTGTSSVPSQYMVTNVTSARIYVNITLGSYKVVGFMPDSPLQVLRLPDGTEAPAVNVGDGE